MIRLALALFGEDVAKAVVRVRKKLHPKTRSFPCRVGSYSEHNLLVAEDIDLKMKFSAAFLATIGSASAFSGSS